MRQRQQKETKGLAGKVRERLEVATQKATEEGRIGRRTKAAIIQLLHSRNIRTILAAVMCLGECSEQEEKEKERGEEHEEGVVEMIRIREMEKGRERMTLYWKYLEKEK